VSEITAERCEELACKAEFRSIHLHSDSDAELARILRAHAAAIRECDDVLASIRATDYERQQAARLLSILTGAP
jgi:hypothetical protein